MTRRIYRSSRDRMIAGVAGGLAEYFDIDPVLTRAGFVILTLSGGLGILTYIVLWIIMPYDYEMTPMPQQSQYGPNEIHSFTGVQDGKGNNNDSTKRYVIAGIFIVLGVLLLLDNLIQHISFKFIFPILLIIIGVIIFIIGSNFSKREKL